MVPVIEARRQSSEPLALETLLGPSPRPAPPTNVALPHRPRGVRDRAAAPTRHRHAGMLENSAQEEWREHGRSQLQGPLLEETQVPGMTNSPNASTG